MQIKPHSPIIWLLPLLLFPLLNVWQGGTFPRLQTAVWLCVWAFAEEGAFRGLLPTLLQRWLACSPVISAWLSSVSFALFHLGNLTAADSVNVVVLQCVTALGIGFYLCALAHRIGNIYAGTFIHCLLNLTSQNAAASPALWVPVSAACVWCGYRLFFSLNDKGEAS